MSENHRSISLMSFSLFTDITFGKTKGHVEVTVSARVSGWPLERSKGRGGQGKGEAITLTRRSRLMLCLKRSGRERCVWESKGLWLQTGGELTVNSIISQVKYLYCYTWWHLRPPPQVCRPYLPQPPASLYFLQVASRHWKPEQRHIGLFCPSLVPQRATTTKL